jgi:hypothetical protein
LVAYPGQGVYECARWGHVAEWLRNGLQNRAHQFNSGRGLHSISLKFQSIFIQPCSTDSACYRLATLRFGPVPEAIFGAASTVATAPSCMPGDDVTVKVQRDSHLAMPQAGDFWVDAVFGWTPLASSKVAERRADDCRIARFFTFSPSSTSRGHWLICQRQHSLHDCAEANEHHEQLKQIC